jgi:chemotaxis family two-component system response regulator Rcp1
VSGHALIILIVDDDVSQLHLFQALVRELKLPHECYYTSTGEDALKFIRQQSPFEAAPRPDIVLLDLNMPGMSGFEVLRHLKEDPEMRSIPAIVFSSSRALNDVSECYQEHANAFIQKPMDLDATLEVLEGIHRFWSRVLTPD